MPNLLARVALGSVLVAAAVGAETIPITTCHDHIERGRGQLMADLDCSATPLAIGVDVIRGKLYLNGHTISGTEIGVAGGDRCTIYGPGTITGSTSGVNVFPSKPGAGKATVVDATISGNALMGIGADKIRVTRSTISGNGGVVFQGNPIAASSPASARPCAPPSSRATTRTASARPGPSGSGTRPCRATGPLRAAMRTRAARPAGISSARSGPA